MGEDLQPRIGRRDLLRGAGALGLTLGAFGLIHFRDEALAAPAPAPAPAGGKVAHQWAMVIDLRRCDGCGQCTLACQKEHFLAPDQTWIRVYSMTDAEGQTFHMPRPCMQCEQAPCLRVCPVGATFRTDEGVVLVDQNVCIGCRACMAACPYEARYFNWTTPPAAPRLPSPAMPEYPVPQKKGTVGKCVFCVHLTDVGKLPACVSGCPMQAIYIGDLATDTATNGSEVVPFADFLREHDAVRFKDDLGTRPRVYYILGHGQDLNF
jgi:molybdopterin-containing oxidoreductase family iron-sulfur binding subunit